MLGDVGSAPGAGLVGYGCEFGSAGAGGGVRGVCGVWGRCVGLGVGCGAALLVLITAE